MESLLFSLLFLALFVIIAGWIINKFVADPTFKNIAYLVVAVLALIWLYRIFTGASTGIRVGEIIMYMPTFV